MEPPRSSVRESFHWLAEKLDKDRFVAAMAIAWALWTACNEVVFNSGNPKRETMAQTFVKMKDAAIYKDRTSIPSKVPPAGSYNSCSAAGRYVQG